MKKKILFATITAVLVGIAFGVYLYNKPHESIANDTPAFKMEAVALAGEYEQDEKAANAKYLGKIIEVEGIVAEKLKDPTGKFNVTLQGADLSGVGCEFEPNMQEMISGLKEGQKVKVKGICTGMLMDVVLVDCVIINENN